MVSLRAIRNIKPGEELTIYYFDNNNKGCQCSDCAEKKRGYFRKLKPGERRDRDLFTLEDDETILKVCNICTKHIWYLVLVHVNICLILVHVIISFKILEKEE